MLISPGNSTQVSALVGFIDSHRDRFGVEPVCAVLEIPPSTYYAAKKRECEVSPRDVRDEWLKKEIMRVWEDRGNGRAGMGRGKCGASCSGRESGGAVHGGAADAVRWVSPVRRPGGRSRARPYRPGLGGPGRLTCWNGTLPRSRRPPVGRRYHLCRYGQRFCLYRVRH